MKKFTYGIITIQILTLFSNGSAYAINECYINGNITLGTEPCPGDLGSDGGQDIHCYNVSDIKSLGAPPEWVIPMNCPAEDFGGGSGFLNTLSQNSMLIAAVGGAALFVCCVAGCAIRPLKRYLKQRNRAIENPPGQRNIEVVRQDGQNTTTIANITIPGVHTDPALNDEANKEFPLNQQVEMETLNSIKITESENSPVGQSAGSAK